MNVGLLICDHINSEFEEEFGDYPDMFMKLFPEFNFILFDAINGHFPDDLNLCDCYMATGSRFSVYDDVDWIHKLKDIIVQIEARNKIFIGFCFGHQLIGEALGGKVEKSKKGWCVGVHNFEVLNEQRWMKPQKSELNLLMMCQDQISVLPNNSKVLATNNDCPFAMIQVGENILGLQAHPEFTSIYNKRLMEIRKERIGNEVVASGINSLKNSIDRKVIQAWVVNFIQINLNGDKAVNIS